MRISEFIDFLNRESLSGVEMYSHLEVREKNKDGKMVLKDRYRQARREHRKLVRKEKKNEEEKR